MAERAPAARITRRDVTVAIWRGLGLAVLAWLALAVLRVSVSPVVLLVCGLAAGAMLRVAAAVRPQPTEPSGGAAAATAPAPDRPFAGVLAWEDRIAWALQDPRRFESALRPALVALADDLLVDRHSITRASHPDLARQLLGERLWNLATCPPPPAGQVRAVPMRVPDLVSDLERL